MTVTTLSNIPSQAIPGGLTPLLINDTSGAFTVLAGVSGKVIEVWAYDLMTTGITDIVFLDNATPQSAPMGFGAASGPSALNWPLPVGRPNCDISFARFTTTDGNDLKMTSSGAGIRVSGTIWVRQRLK